jgi:hypothetical protein
MVSFLEMFGEELEVEEKEAKPIPELIPECFQMFPADPDRCEKATQDLCRGGGFTVTEAKQ